MDAARCNIFKNVWDKECSHVVHVLQVLDAIQSGRWKDRIEAFRAEEDVNKRKRIKFNLPCVTFSGIFRERLADEIEEYSRLIVLDVDTTNEKKIRWLKNQMTMDGYVAACFESPSGGLKILFEVSSSEQYHSGSAFVQLENYMMGHYDTEVDPSGKDVNRLCFVSYDPDLYINTVSDVFPVKEAETSSFRSTKSTEPPAYTEPSYNLGHIFDVCDGWVRDSLGPYAKGNRNNFIHALACNLNRAGVEQDDALMIVWHRYSSLEFKEVQNTVFSAYKHNKNQFGTRPIWEKKSPQYKMFS